MNFKFSSAGSVISATLFIGCSWGAVYYANNMPDESNPDRKFSYFLVQHQDIQFDEIAITDQDVQNQNNHDYICQWGFKNENLVDNTCAFLEIPPRDTHKTVDVKDLQLLTEENDNFINKYEQLSLPDNSPLIGKYYLLKTETKLEEGKAINTLTAQNGSNKTIFEVLGQFSADWNFSGTSDLIIAKLKELKNEDDTVDSYEETCSLMQGNTVFSEPICSVVSTELTDENWKNHNFSDAKYLTNLDVLVKGNYYIIQLSEVDNDGEQQDINLSSQSIKDTTIVVVNKDGTKRISAYFESKFLLFGDILGDVSYGDENDEPETEHPQKADNLRKQLQALILI